MIRMRLSLCFLICYILLLIPGSSVFLCIGEEGHFALTNPLSEPCCPSDHSHSETNEFDSVHPHETACSCWDIPITLEFDADWIVSNNKQIDFKPVQSSHGSHGSTPQIPFFQATPFELYFQSSSYSLLRHHQSILSVILRI